MPSKSKKATAKEAEPQKPAEEKTAAPEPVTKEGKQAHRTGKPSNPFLVRHPPPRLGRPVK